MKMKAIPKAMLGTLNKVDICKRARSGACPNGAGYEWDSMLQYIPAVMPWEKRTDHA